MPVQSIAETQPRPSRTDAHPRLISKRQLADNLGVSTRTIDTWLARRKIPCLKLSPRLHKFRLEDVERALFRYEVKEVGRAN